MTKYTIFYKEAPGTAPAWLDLEWSSESAAEKVAEAKTATGDWQWAVVYATSKSQVSKFEAEAEVDTTITLQVRGTKAAVAGFAKELSRDAMELAEERPVGYYGYTVADR